MTVICGSGVALSAKTTSPLNCVSIIFGYLCSRSGADADNEHRIKKIFDELKFSACILLYLIDKWRVFTASGDLR